jgi:4-hydroxythreonine-4-phosphate dehydrogenase
MKKSTIAISLGDLNGVGIEIALRSHEEVCTMAKPIYCISQKMLEQACERLAISKPEQMTLFPIRSDFEIEPAKISKKSGRNSYTSFLKAIELCEKKIADAVVTLPIHKEAWHKAGIEHKGHTDMLREHFKQEAIMMLGCDKLYVSLFTEHIPLKKVASKIRTKELREFLLALAPNIKGKKIAVLGLNPHAGDGGVLGKEEKQITKAIKEANEKLQEEIFTGPMVPDTAFTKSMRKEYHHYVAMYHDQGLIPLKALHFDESINVSLNLPIIRTSVDHGTAFDIAYQNKKPSCKSYLNAVKAALTQINGQGI